MIPIKLVETIFLKYWALLIPALLVPLLVIGLTHESEKYQSTATIWVSQPVAGESAAIGHTNNWVTPAQNQAQVLNDLFSTEAFRVEMLRAAGLVDSSMTEKDAKSAAARVSIWASSSGANLVHITSTAAAPETAKKLVDAAIDQYLVRATTEFQRDAELSTTYYTQQLAVANQELATRQAALASYLASHPRAANRAAVTRAAITASPAASSRPSRSCRSWTSTRASPTNRGPARRRQRRLSARRTGRSAPCRPCWAACPSPNRRKARRVYSRHSRLRGNDTSEAVWRSG